jgi:hypothetical protein
VARLGVEWHRGAAHDLEVQHMANPKMKYIGDAAMKRLLSRYDCPYPLHVVRIRFWGEIVSPAWNVSPIQTIENLWPEGLPAFESEREATRFFQALLGLWHNMAKYQDGKPPLKLTPVGPMRCRDDVRKAANLRVEELHDGFLQGFTGGQESIGVPAGVGDILTRVEKGIELLATTRNTFAEPPGPARTTTPWSPPSSSPSARSTGAFRVTSTPWLPRSRSGGKMPSRADKAAFDPHPTETHVDWSIVPWTPVTSFTN